MSEKVSEPFSFDGWKIIEFLKGQKKTVLAIIGWALAFIFTSNELIATGSAFVFAGIISILEYYFKKVDNG